MPLEWHGDEIKARIHKAADAEVQVTAEDGVREAAVNTPVLTGEARDSLAVEMDGSRATWGYHVPYGIWIEIGDRGRAGAHALRRAADRVYPGLGERIGRRAR